MKCENADYVLPSREEPLYTASRQKGIPNIVYRMCRSSDEKRVVGAWILYEDLDTLYKMKKGWDIPRDRSPSFEVRVTTDKGRGLFATRDIRRGECILAERPLLVAPVRFLPSPLGEIPRNVLAEKALLQCLYWLEQEDRKELLNLHNCKPTTECGPIFGIVRTNGMGADFGASKVCQEYSCVGLKASMANHRYAFLFSALTRFCEPHSANSCSPNADHNIDVSDPLIMMHAVRDIKKGDEITTHYLDPILPRAQRMGSLRREFGFTCSCPVCSLTGENIRTSNKRRRFIGEIFEKEKLSQAFESWLKGRSDSFLDRLLTTLDYMDQEQMHVRRDGVLEMLAIVYACLGDKRNFQKWSSEMTIVVHGHDDRMREDQRASWMTWLRKPEGMPHWGIRAKPKRR